MRQENGLVERLRRHFGADLAAAIQRFAEFVSRQEIEVAHVYASAVYPGGTCHLVVVKAQIPRLQRSWSENVRARFRAYLESFEGRLPYGMPYCAFAKFADEWHFFDFDESFDDSIRDELAATFLAVSSRRFAAQPLRYYIWSDASRRHFHRTGYIEIAE